MSKISKALGGPQVAKEAPTNGEQAFANLCSHFGYEAIKIQRLPGQSKTPDFEVTAHGLSVAAEVKDFDTNPVALAIEEKLLTESFYVGEVDFSFDGGLKRKLFKQREQLLEASNRGIATIAVLYSNRFLGPTDHQIRHALYEISIPEEISAVLMLRNENVQGMTPPWELRRNPGANVPLHEELFAEVRILER
jgi:hypothetical protein